MTKKKPNQNHLLPRSHASLTHHRLQLVQEDRGGGMVAGKFKQHLSGQKQERGQIYILKLVFNTHVNFALKCSQIKSL